MPTIRPEKAREYLTVVRHTLLGRSYHQSARALEVMLKYHAGVRKDGTTPEWAHPVMVTLQLLTLDASWPEEWRDDIYAASLLHDTLEDKEITRDELAQLLTHQAYTTVLALSRKEKMCPELKRSKEDYYGAMHMLPLPAPIKLADRNHNFDSMIGVFAPEKQLQYIEEAENFILPMAKRARRNWPQVYFPLQNLTSGLKGQINLLKAIHGQ